MALRATEIQAPNTLTGEIVVQMGADKSQKVAYNSVVAVVKQSLDSAADDPDLPELFEFLMSCGVGQNSFLDDFFEFCGVRMDSKYRQLRFGAFAVARCRNRDRCPNWL